MSNHFTLLLLFFFAFPVIPVRSQVISPATKITASTRNLNDIFGFSVAKDGDFMVVGAPQDDRLGIDAGAAYVYKKQPDGSWREIQVLTASDGMADDIFGESVAIHGNRLIVSSPKAIAAYVFEKNSNDVWTEVAKLTAFDGVKQDYFKNVTIYGNYAAVGSYSGFDISGNNYISSAGAVYIYERTGNGQWTFLQKITASDRVVAGFFFVVAMHGNTLIVGSDHARTDSENENPLANAGAVYVFERNASGTWDEVQKITPAERHVGDAFGMSVAISEDHILVGARQESVDFLWAGSAYLFKRDATNGWVQSQKLESPNKREHDLFGTSVALDGRYALVSCLYDDLDAAGNYLEDTGGAYLYEHSGDTNWVLKQKLVAPDRFNLDFFGISVVLDGTTILIGASREDEDVNGQNTLFDAGSVYAFEMRPEVNDPADLSVFIYPNPTEGLLHITSGVPFEKMKISLKDVSGKQLGEATFFDLQQIDYKINQAAGVYFLELESERGSRMERIVVR